MTAYVVPDPASPCWGGRDFRQPPSFVPNWPERPMFTTSIAVTDNGDGTVTASVVGADGLTDNMPVTVSKTVDVVAQTQTKQYPARAPEGGQLRWRVIDPEGGDIVFSSAVMAAECAVGRNERQPA